MREILLLFEVIASLDYAQGVWLCGGAALMIVAAAIVALALLDHRAR
ncbi:MAG: hypothetical protein ACTHN5_00255 [Phycisphaerae bacterium]